MFERGLFAFLISVLLTPFALADHLPKENWETMSPTVKIVSYKHQFSGYTVTYGSGSGTIVTPGGKIITNNHVIFDEVQQMPLDAFKICITFAVEKEPLCHYTASLIARDKELDIAILQMEKTDVFGNVLPGLKNLDYKTEVAPKEQDEVQIKGYPASGGETITITKGQISGFDTFNNFKYIKTDTDFDHGSSGGTALDNKGGYIGIPTYIRSYSENVGYFLDLREAEEWIDDNIDNDLQTNEAATSELKREMQRFITANQAYEYQTEAYPFLEIKLPEGWHFKEIDDDRLFAAQSNLNDPVGLSVMFDNFLFPVDEDYLKKLDENFVETRRFYSDFKKEPVVFAGQEGFRITYSTYNQRNTIIYIPYGYSLVGISYGINLDREKEQLKAIEEILNHLRFTEIKQKEPGLPQTLRLEQPGFQLQVFDNWRIQKPMSRQTGDVLAEAVERDNFEGKLSMYYSWLPRDQRGLTGRERLDEVVKGIAYGNAKLITKKEDVKLDGLPGYLYIMEYEGGKYQQIRKKLILTLQDKEYELTFEYDDIAETFDSNIDTIKKTIVSFRRIRPERAQTNETDLGVLAERFIDIRYHRFAIAISELADKNIIEGHKDKRFRPEFYARRADALKMILESKNHLEKERKLGKEVNFEVLTTGQANELWFEKYERFAQENGIIGAGTSLRPYEAITLTEALGWLVGVYEIPLWKGEIKERTKRYMDKGYQLEWIPRGLDDPEQKLTRAELSYLVNTVYNQAK